MLLSEIEPLLISRLGMPLPGAAAHSSMRARFLDNTFPKFTHTLPARSGAVLILLYQDGEKVRFPIIRRQVYAGAHSGQVSLPGGKSEAGETAMQTALRETEEEIGVPRTLPQVLGTLTEFFVIPSNFMVTPIVATIDHMPTFVRDEYEVADILSGDLDSLVRENAILEAEIIASGQYKMVAPHFMFGKAMVWGATAMMLNEFRHILRDALESRTR